MVSTLIFVGRVTQSVLRQTTDWTVRGWNPGGARFSAHPYRPWDPPSLLNNGYRVFPGGKVGRGLLLTSHHLLVPWSWKSRATHLPTLWATTGPVTGTLKLLSYSDFQQHYYTYHNSGLPTLVLNIGTKCGCVVNFRNRPLYLFSCCGKQKNLPQKERKPLVQPLHEQGSPSSNIHMFVTGIFEECAYRTLK